MDNLTVVLLVLKIYSEMTGNMGMQNRFMAPSDDMSYNRPIPPSHNVGFGSML